MTTSVVYPPDYGKLPQDHLPLADRLRAEFEPSETIFLAANRIEKLEATIRCCIVAMRSAYAAGDKTDWTNMIDGLEKTLGER